MEKAYKSCQSCGMPLKRDEMGGSGNSDGSRSTIYYGGIPKPAR